jgi:hypothetical protein
LPALQADGQVYINTSDVVSYLVKTASVKVKAGSDLIPLIHEDRFDPNFAKVLAVSISRIVQILGLNFVSETKASFKLKLVAPNC